MPARARNLRQIMYVVAALLVAAGVGFLLARPALNGTPADPVVTGQKELAIEKSEVYLYFGDPQGRFLRAEQHVLNRPADPGRFGRMLIDALVQGPQKGLGRTLPKGVHLRTFFVTGSTAYVDFGAESFSGHPGGVEAELLSIYSIVNTLVVNVDTIREVKILIEGQERTTLAGHVDLQRPFVADMMWVR